MYIDPTTHKKLKKKLRVHSARDISAGDIVELDDGRAGVHKVDWVDREKGFIRANSMSAYGNKLGQWHPDGDMPTYLIAIKRSKPLATKPYKRAVRL